MTPDLSTNKLQTTRIKASDGTTVILSYLKPEAQAMRDTVASIRLRGDKRPSLSLLARRSIGLYLARLENTRTSDPEAFAEEIATLEKMTAPPCPKTLQRAHRKSPA